MQDPVAHFWKLRLEAVKEILEKTPEEWAEFKVEKIKVTDR